MRGLIFGAVAVAAMAAAFVPARATPVDAAPVYAIDDYPFQKAPALTRWRSVLAREVDLGAHANPDDCKDGLPRLDCAAKEAALLEQKLKDQAPAEQVRAVYGYF